MRGADLLAKECSHANLINTFLASIGEQSVNLDPFRTLPSSSAAGAQQIGRLTNLMNLTVDTSYYNRYRSAGNPDFGDTFPQVVNITNRPTIPFSDDVSAREMQVIAQTAAFHFAAIEQGGSSLYNSLSAKVTNLDVLAILSSIGPTEVYHFAVFQTALEGISAIRSGDGLEFPDIRNDPTRGALMPKPCKFLNVNFPVCSVIRPFNTVNAGAVAAATGLARSGLFAGQSQTFINAAVGAIGRWLRSPRANGAEPQDGEAVGRRRIPFPRPSGRRHSEVQSFITRFPRAPSAPAVRVLRLFFPASRRICPRFSRRVLA